MTPQEHIEPGTISQIEIIDADGKQRSHDGDFPLSIGGPSADVPVDASTASPLAYLGLSEGEIFVQPADDRRSVVVNGAAVATSKWLGDGDVLRFGAAWIVVEMHGELVRLKVRNDSSGRSEPPRIVPPPRATEAPRTIEPIRFEPRQDLGGTRRRWGLGPFGLAVAVVLIGLAAAAFFLLTSSSVGIAVEPSPDRVAIEGGFVLELGGRHVLRPGNYVLRAEKAGYSPLEAPLQIDRDSRQNFYFELAKLPGRLAVTASVAGAEILVNGTIHGVTPLAALELPPGEHQVTVRADRHQDFVGTVTIEGAGSEQALSADLAPLWADVSFASEPAGARVRVEGEELGTTPLTAEVLAGSHGYSLVLAGHKVHRGRLEVTAGEAQSLPSTRLQPADGNLVLTSVPAGATVSVGGVYRGQTPLDLYLTPGLEYEVSVSKAGHDTEKRQVQVVSGKSQELDVSLTIQEGDVQISAWPADAELIVDGTARGGANQKLRLTAVDHQIEIRKDGFVAHRQTVTPLPGVPQWVEVTLKPVGEAEREKKAAATPEVVTRHDHELRLIAPGKLRMGASRRQPGRRANEVLREVELTRAFYLGAHEVSNRQFLKFRAEHSSGVIAGNTLELAEHPAVRVTWDEAAAYCNWLSFQEGLPPAYIDVGGKMKAAVPMTTGYRLPTEAEWSWAARYGDGGPRKYPWGESLPVPADAGNYADASASGVLPSVLTGYNDQFPVTAPVSSFEANRRGIFHLGGNVAEWVHDLYAIRFGGSSEVERDPLGPTEGEHHVIRGSSWMHSTITELRLTYRDYGNAPRPDVGFRVARYAE